MWMAALLLACSGGKDEPVDQDGDGHPFPQDCDDVDDTIHPGADEVPYDGVDQDCADGDLVDVDGDGQDLSTDCDDEDPSIFAGAEEIPYDGIDQDCVDGDLDDLDADGTSPPGDCDDTDPEVHPGAVDPFGDDADSDCDGADGVDGDADGFASADSGGPDCDDGEPLVHPDADEVWYDGTDSDCDGVCDFDQDGDGATLPGLVVLDGSACDLDPTPGVRLSYDDCDDEDALASTTVLLSTFPADGSTTVGVGTTIRANLSATEPAATLTLTDDAGNAVPGVSAVDGPQVAFLPAAPLAEGATYSVDLAYSCGPTTFGFTTVPRVDAATLVGRVWEADIAGADWVAPAGVGPLVAPFVDTTVLVAVLAEAGTTLDLRLAQASSGVQDLCAATIDLPATPFDGNPSFLVGPTDLPFGVGGLQLKLGQATVSGMFAADGSEIAAMGVSGEIDVSTLTPLLGAPACPLLAALGVPCGACADGSGNFCVTGVLEDVPAPELPGAGAVVPRSAAEILADPGCP